MLDLVPENMRRRLIVFSRYPVPGKTKTRLIPVLGPAGAAELQRALTEHTLSRLAPLAAEGQVEIEVRFTGADRQAMAAWLGEAYTYQPQGEGDLGSRMWRAGDTALQSGVGRVVIVGCDCPGISARLVQTAFDLLAFFDLVLGPAVDGGYYLIGLRQPTPSLFDSISWGSDSVLAATCQAAANLGLSLVMLDCLADIDRPEDLPLWENTPSAPDGPPTPGLTIVCPALNEENFIFDTLASLAPAAEAEVIVVDGGSSDATPELAAKAGARLLVAKGGRAMQLNAGAVAATAPALVFLHADTRLPPGFDRHVHRALSAPGVAAGCFRLAIDAPGFGLRLVEKMANLRTRLLQLPYGDQAIFCRRDLFFAVGGFPPLPIMEDFVLGRRLRRHGRIVVLRQLAATSARRWQQLGIVRTTLINQAIVLGYYLGIDPYRLARWYRGCRPNKSLSGIR